MYANPSLYNRSNYLQVRDGSKMVKLIKNEYQSKEVDTILDIGCGTGNLTDLLSRELKPKRLVAFDLAGDMIKFARKRAIENATEDGFGRINFYQADACEPFESLSQKLCLAASSVDLVISFYCMHWVPNKRQAFENIFKFLKPNGKFYFIISVWNDLYPIQNEILKNDHWNSRLLQWTSELMAKNKNLYDVKPKKEKEIFNLVNFETHDKPDHDTLNQLWKNYCLNSSLVMEEMNFVYTDYPFKRVQDFNDQVESVCFWLNIVPIELHTQFLNDYFDLIRSNYVEKQIKKQKSRRRSLNILDPELIVEPRLLAVIGTEQEAITMFRFDYIYATVVGRKPSMAI